MGVVRTKSGLASTTRTTRDQLIIFIDIIAKIHFLEGRRRSRCMPGSASASASASASFIFYSTVVIRISSLILIFIYRTRKKNESGPQPSDHVASALSIPDVLRVTTNYLCRASDYPWRSPWRATPTGLINITTRCHHSMSHYNQRFHLAPTHGPPRTLRRPSSHRTLRRQYPPRKPSPTRYWFGVNVSDNIRIIWGVTS